MGLPSTLGQRKPFGLVPRFFSVIVPAGLCQKDRHPSGLELRHSSSGTVAGAPTWLFERRSAGLALYGRRAGQDLSDLASTGSTIAVLGWTGFWWRSLLRRLPLSQHIHCLLPGTGGPHRSTVCWSASGAVMENDAPARQGSSN